ncbi:hypothetical protein [Paenibacillus auburnensis]|uniref:hypothetical protein n=1 Tax=Paenibacillus auburnensis TaxID=2905649 RepID=UPI001F4906BB|nr:hypothetical protein [Paenibacillus auburnensis]
MRFHESKESEKDPDILEILLPLSQETKLYPVPFCTKEQLLELGTFYNRSGVYAFYGPGDNWRRKPLYIGATNDIWGIAEHIFGTSPTKHIEIDDENYSPHKVL